MKIISKQSVFDILPVKAQGVTLLVVLTEDNTPVAIIMEQKRGDKQAASSISIIPADHPTFKEQLKAAGFDLTPPEIINVHK